MKQITKKIFSVMLALVVFATSTFTINLFANSYITSDNAYDTFARDMMSDDSLISLSETITTPSNATRNPQLNRPADYSGDVNNDREINAADATMLRRYLAQTNKASFIRDNPSFNVANADVNGDSKIDNEDVALLRRYLAATDPSTVSLGQQRQIHTLDFSNGLYFRDIVYQNGEVWYAVEPLRTSIYEVIISPHNLNTWVNVYDTWMWPIDPVDGGFTLYAGETYYICASFAGVTSPQEYECMIEPRVAGIFEGYWDYYGELYGTAPSKWLAVTPMKDEEYSFSLDADSGVSVTLWELSNSGLKQLSAGNNWSRRMQQGMVYLFEISATVEEFYCLQYIINLQSLGNIAEQSADKPSFPDTVNNGIQRNANAGEYPSCGNDGSITVLSTNRDDFFMYGRVVFWHMSTNPVPHSHTCTAFHTIPQMAQHTHSAQAADVIGWSSNPGGTGIVYRLNADGITNTTALDFTYSDNWYAILNTMPSPTPPPGTSAATIRYEHGDATDGSPPPTQHFNAPSFVTILGRGSLVNDGWNFAGWTDAGGRKLTAGDSHWFRSSAVLRPRWTRSSVSYTIIYDKNDATHGSAPGTQRILPPIKNSDTIRGKDSLDKDGHVFIGWNTNKNATTANYLPGNRVPAMNLTLYAIFRPKAGTCWVNYNANGASGFVMPQEYTPGVQFRLRYANTLIYPHRTFNGWQSGNSTDRYAEGQLVTFYTNSETLVAQWRISQYKLTFHGNHAAVTSGVPQQIIRDVGTAIPIGGQGSMRTPPSHIFLGWNTEDDGSGTWYGTGIGHYGSISLIKDTDLYAIWGTAPSASTLSLTINSWNPVYTPDNIFVTVTSNTTWNVSVSTGARSWLTVDVPTNRNGDGSFWIKANVNNTNQSRPGTITVTGGGITREIKVTQDGFPNMAVSKTLNVPLYRQEEHNTCGSACGKMILESYGIYVSEEEFKERARRESGANNDFTMVFAVKDALNFFLEREGHTTRYQFIDTSSYDTKRFQELILRNIISSYPVQAQIWVTDKDYFPYTSTTSGHYVVIRGMQHGSDGYTAVINDSHPDWAGVYYMPIDKIRAYTKARYGYVICVVG